MTQRKQELRQQILDLVGEYCAEAFPARDFVPGESAVPISGKVFDGAEMRLLVDSSLDFWLTTGRFAELCHRVAVSALVVVDPTEVVPHARVVRRDADRLFVRRQGLLVLL